MQILYSVLSLFSWLFLACKSEVEYDLFEQDYSSLGRASAPAHHLHSKKKKMDLLQRPEHCWLQPQVAVAAD